jgi:hypothetical protein
MTQKYVDFIFEKFKNTNSINKFFDEIQNINNKSTQTPEGYEFFFNLTKTKRGHFYYSKSYKDYVLCLEFSNRKKYILTRENWKLFRRYIKFIDNVFYE